MKSQMTSSTSMVIFIIVICVIGFLVILLVLIKIYLLIKKLSCKIIEASGDYNALSREEPGLNGAIPLNSLDLEDQIQLIPETLSEQINCDLLINNSSKFYILELNVPKSINSNIKSVRSIKTYTKEILIKSIFDNIEEVLLSYSNVESVGNIKKKIADSLGSHADNFILFYDNKNLDNIDIFVFEIDIEKLKFCHLKPLNIDITKYGPDGEMSMLYKYTDSEERGIKEVLKKYPLRIMANVLKENKAFLDELITFQNTKSHGGFVRLNGVFTDDNYFYVSMEKMEESIKDYIIKAYKARKPLSEEIIVKWAKQILLALKYLHDRGIIHHNIKPSSIFLDKDNNIKLASFGIAKYFRSRNNSLSLKPQQLQAPTFRYSAPEHCESEKCGVESDTWSFGATMIEIATGKQPFDGMNEPHAVLEIGWTKRIPFKLEETRSSKLKDFIDKCLIADPKIRVTVNDLLNHDFLHPK